MIRLIFAEASVLLAYLSLRESEVAMVVNPDYFLLLSLVPIMLFSARRNPYPFGLFVLLSILSIPHYLPNSELFHSSLDLAYFLTGSEAVRILESVVASRSVNPIYILAIASLYVSSEVYTSAIRKREIYGGFPAVQPAILVLVISLIPAFIYGFMPSYPDAFYLGVAGAILILIYAVVRK